LTPANGALVSLAVTLPEIFPVVPAKRKELNTISEYK